MARKLLFLLAIPLVLFAYQVKNYYWKYNFKGKYYILYLRFKGPYCPQKGDVLIFITQKGRIYRKTFGRSSCFVKKRFKGLEGSKLLVLIFKINSFSVERLGVLRTPFGEE